MAKFELNFSIKHLSNKINFIFKKLSKKHKILLSYFHSSKVNLKKLKIYQMSIIPDFVLQKAIDVIYMKYDRDHSNTLDQNELVGAFN